MGVKRAGYLPRVSLICVAGLSEEQWQDLRAQQAAKSEADAEDDAAVVADAQTPADSADNGAAAKDGAAG